MLFNFFLEDIDNFFNFKNNKIKELNKHYNEIDIQKLNCHIQFKIIKDNYLNYKKKYEEYLSKNILDIFNNDKYILNELNSILDNIMEFYIILNIFNKNNKNIIIHTGLVHSEKIIFWLTHCYFYETSEEKGITKVKDLEKLTPNTNGCLKLSKTIDDHL